MIWAQWGLKDNLLGDPDVWLCHQCNDCSTYCPRGAKPGDVLAALRSYAIMHFAFPEFLAKLFSCARYLPVVVAFPTILMFAFLFLSGRLAFTQGGLPFSPFVPVRYLAIVGAVVAAFALTVASAGLVRFWGSLRRFEVNLMLPQENPTRSNFFSSLLSALGEILTHRNFKQCGTSRSRYYAHLAILYGALLLFLAVSIHALYQLIGGSFLLPLTEVIKVGRGLGSFLVFAGCTLAIFRRLSQRGEAGVSTYYDWFFVGLVYLVAIASLTTEAAILARQVMLAYSSHLVQMMLVFTLFAYAPFSKFAHFLYRTLAMTWAKQIGRKTWA